MEAVRIAIFGSGQGSNARTLLKASLREEGIRVALLLTDRPDSGFPKLAETEGVPLRILSASEAKDGELILQELREHDVHLIVLAGYFRKIPEKLVKAYRRRILNVHPSLLPDFGGKGMYGERVHRAVIEAGRKKSGITVHLVDEDYDTGAPIFQKECPVHPEDDAETLGERVRSLEHEHYPKVVLQRAKELLDKE